MKRSIEEIKENIRKIHGDKYDLSYITKCNYKDKLTIRCPEHGFFYPTYDNFVNKGSQCPYCRGLNKKTNETFMNELRETFGDKYDYSLVEYKNARTEVEIICPKHGIFKRTPNKLVSRGLGCPHCKTISKLESLINHHLNKNGVGYEQQKTFEWLINENKYHLYLDFFIPKFNVGIECQGEQHFKQVYFKGVTNIDKRNQIDVIVGRDTIKNRLCKENGVKLLYFIDENVDVSLLNGNYNKENSFKKANEIMHLITINPQLFS